MSAPSSDSKSSPERIKMHVNRPADWTADIFIVSVHSPRATFQAGSLSYLCMAGLLISF